MTYNELKEEYKDYDLRTGSIDWDIINESDGNCIIDAYYDVDDREKTIWFDVLKEQRKDNVNSPSHYTDGKIEVIDFIEDKKLNYHRGNAIKYISRAGKKDKNKEIEDLQKAVWYLNREINRLKQAAWYEKEMKNNG